MRVTTKITTKIVGSTMTTFAPFGQETGVLVNILGLPIDWSKVTNRTLEQLAQLTKESGANHLYLPNTSYDNAKVIGPEEETWYESKCHQVKVRRGPNINGLLLPPKSAVFVSSNDDPVIVVRNYETEEVVVATTGLSSLIRYPESDPRLVCNRETESVIEEVVELFDFRKKTKKRDLLSVQICGGLWSANVSYPTFTVKPLFIDNQNNYRPNPKGKPKVTGQDNINLLRKIESSWGNCLIDDEERIYGHLCLPLLIKRQFNFFCDGEWILGFRDSPIDIFRNVKEGTLRHYLYHCEARTGRNEKNGFLVINTRNFK